MLQPDGGKTILPPAQISTHHRRITVLDTGTIRRRSEIPVELTWDLTTAFPDDDAWEQDLPTAESSMAELESLAGTISLGAGASFCPPTRSRRRLTTHK